jgi:hypothetical protein
MDNYAVLVNLFSTSIPAINIIEDFDQFQVSMTTATLQAPSEALFIDTKSSFLKYQDKIVITIKIEGYEDNLFSCNFSDIEYCVFQSKINECIKLNDDENPFIIQIHIEKTIKKYIVVYDTDSFASYLEKLELSDLLIMIKERIYDNDSYIIFANEKVENNDSGIIIVNEIIGTSPNKAQSLEDHEHCHCIISGNSLLLPRFYYSTIDNRVGRILKRISIISSICHLASFSEIKNNSIYIKCIGYKTIFGEIEWNDSFKYTSEIYKIWDWVYANRNIEDKRGIFLNILSLNIENISELLVLKDDLYDSIISSHEIYLKENVNQYIHVKSVFIEHQISLLSNINEIVDSIVDNFKRNFIGFFTFLISVVVLNSISTGKIDNIFNNTIASISYLLLAVSLLMLIFCIVEIIQKWKRQKSVIDNTKKEYSDVLNKNDIENIFTKSININEAKKSLIRNTLIFSAIWIICIVCIFFTIRYLNSIVSTKSAVNRYKI